MVYGNSFPIMEFEKTLIIHWLAYAFTYDEAYTHSDQI